MWVIMSSFTMYNPFTAPRVVDGRAVCRDLGAGPGVEATGDDQARRVDLHVEADTRCGLHESALMRLVRRFVLAEPDVTIGPKSLACAELRFQFGERASIGPRTQSS